MTRKEVLDVIKIILYYLIAIIVGVLLMRPLCGMMANTISNWSFGWIQKTVLLPILFGILYLPFKMQEIPLLKKGKKIPIGPIGATVASIFAIATVTTDAYGWFATIVFSTFFLISLGVSCGIGEDHLTAKCSKCLTKEPLNSNPNGVSDITRTEKVTLTTWACTPDQPYEEADKEYTYLINNLSNAPFEFYEKMHYYNTYEQTIGYYNQKFILTCKKCGHSFEREYEREKVLSTILIKSEDCTKYQLERLKEARDDARLLDEYRRDHPKDETTFGQLMGAFGSSLLSTLEGKESIKFEQSFTDKLVSNNSVKFGKYRKRTGADDINDALNPF